MSLPRIKQLIADKKLICPQCHKPIQKFDKYVDLVATVWDGAGDSERETGGSKVTLICGDCAWTERSEYWANYIEE